MKRNRMSEAWKQLRWQNRMQELEKEPETREEELFTMQFIKKLIEKTRRIITVFFFFFFFFFFFKKKKKKTKKKK